jgi:Tfp pilus assembly protein PilF
MSELAARAIGDSATARALAAELERARAESPWHARASLWLGLLRLAEGDKAAARALLEEVDRLAPTTPGLALRLGLARESTGDRAGAKRAYRRARGEPADHTEAEQRLRGLESSR